ncbi:hypothetical protein BSL82_00530 [Tardibacter chloracetimidivorans]|uniref:NinB family protein n=1 Tax=Tardibacter chloracetimidivorans TaxID=1921510 RepID=A0A1L3ZQS5_9SPHN|nr:hypothetical protein [Tardibacter chloracetimidivorans]API57974.1 hypothetical protein BSL82_00530 [Tardibacter chloracetimidivorans]
MTDKPILTFARSLGSLRPTNSFAEKAIKALGEGDRVVVEIKRSSRNHARHRLYWAMLSVAAENLPTDGMDAELLHDVLKQKLELGHWIELPSGDRIFDGRSTSFSKMSEPEFVAYFERVQKVLAKWLGVPVEALLENAEMEV